jgi:hypothetical protein
VTTGAVEVAVALDRVAVELTEQLAVTPLLVHAVEAGVTVADISRVVPSAPPVPSRVRVGTVNGPPRRSDSVFVTSVGTPRTLVMYVTDNPDWLAVGALDATPP